MVDFACTKIMIIDELVTHTSSKDVSWLASGRSMHLIPKYCNHLIPNQRSVCNEWVSEWSNSFRVTSIHCVPPENRSTRDHILSMCEIIATISVVHGITCGGWRFQIVHQSITEGFSIYSSKSSDVIFHRFQGFGPLLWIDGRYNFWAFVCFFHVPLVKNCMYLV